MINKRSIIYLFPICTLSLQLLSCSQIISPIHQRMMEEKGINQKLKEKITHCVAKKETRNRIDLLYKGIHDNNSECVSLLLQRPDIVSELWFHLAVCEVSKWDEIWMEKKFMQLNLEDNVINLIKIRIRLDHPFRKVLYKAYIRRNNKKKIGISGKILYVGLWTLALTLKMMHEVHECYKQVFPNKALQLYQKACTRLILPTDISSIVARYYGSFLNSVDGRKNTLLDKLISNPLCHDLRKLGGIHSRHIIKREICKRWGGTQEVNENLLLKAAQEGCIDTLWLALSDPKVKQFYIREAKYSKKLIRITDLSNPFELAQSSVKREGFAWRMSNIRSGLNFRGRCVNKRCDIGKYKELVWIGIIGKEILDIGLESTKVNCHKCGEILIDTDVIGFYRCGYELDGTEHNKTYQKNGVARYLEVFDLRKRDFTFLMVRLNIFPKFFLLPQNQLPQGVGVRQS